MKIAVFEMDERDKAFFEERLAGHELLFIYAPLNEDTVSQAKDCEIITTRSYSKLSAEIISQLPKLKFITTRTTGYDHIDIAYCKNNNIIVCNVPDYGSYTVAEHTLALILAISRKLIPSVERTRRGDFRLSGLRGFELYNKTIGIVGLGSIGGAVARIAKAFGMHVIVYTRHHPENTDNEFEHVDLDTLLKTSDIVSLHVPYSKETHHLINKENMRLFKKGSVLINTSRGGVADTEAILMGLDENILSAVGLDVLEEECMVKDEVQLLTSEFLKECDLKTQLLNHVLLTKERAIITPHNAFNSTEALERILETTVKNIENFVSHNPKNVL